MKRAIAMKCTQEQFDDIKDKLVGIEIYKDPYEYIDFGYLTNDFNRENIVSFTNYLGSHRKTHETWNKKIFLEACGIEVNKIEWEYFFEGKWYDSKVQCRIKPTYKKQIENIEALAKEIGYKVTLEKL